MSNFSRYTGLIDKYRSRLPIADGERVISLGEGQTPLIKLVRIPSELSTDVSIYVKYEGLNPTGSFKDRGMTVAVTHAVNEGSKTIICASTGNTSAAAAAYAASAGIRSVVLIPEGKIAMGKLAQAMMYGAEIIQVRGNFDDGMRLVQEVAEESNAAIVNSINPYRLQGQKTAAFEIIDDLGDAPDYHYLPVGNAGNISAYWMGYKEYQVDDLSTKLPVMVGYQASGAAPFLSGQPVESPETIATAIRIGNPQSWDLAWAANRESKGWFGQLDDKHILEVQSMLARMEGIFCEPASAISLAGLIRDINLGKIKEGSQIVCTLTGNGMKDPDVAIEQCKSTSKIEIVEATASAVKKAILNDS